MTQVEKVLCERLNNRRTGEVRDKVVPI